MEANNRINRKKVSEFHGAFRSNTKRPKPFPIRILYRLLIIIRQFVRDSWSLRKIEMFTPDVSTISILKVLKIF